MTTRTRSETVTFANPFRLEGIEDVFPAGNYAIETDEELLEGMSFPVYRRVSTRVLLQPNASQPGIEQTLVIDPNIFDTALQRDQMSNDLAADADIVRRGMSLSR